MPRGGCATCSHGEYRRRPGSATLRNVPDPDPFVGSEALAAGRVNRHRLRSRNLRLCPNVYLPAQPSDPTLQQRITAAWLWSGRTGVIAGSAAAALHGALWVDAGIPVELIHPNTRPPRGFITRRDLLLDGEVNDRGGMRFTTAARTAFDLGRRGTTSSAVARVDALMRATGLTTAQIAEVASRHRHTRGLRQLDQVLSLADAGAQSPKESWLRLVLLGGGLPRPETQICVRSRDGIVLAYLDMGWPEAMVAVEYDGEHHRAIRHHYVKDIRRRETLEAMGWIVITIVAGDRPDDIVRRVRRALARRLTVHPGRESRHGSRLDGTVRG